MSHLTIAGIPIQRTILFAGTLSSLLLSACTPTVNIATPDPVKIDVNMNVDVYTKSDPKKQKDESNQMQAAIDRRTHMAEIQTLKNDRVIGENREGYIEVHTVPTDAAYADYAKKLVSSENNDRAVIYLANAQSQGKPMELVQGEYAQLWRGRAFPGEWIQKDDGSWIQK